MNKFLAKAVDFMNEHNLEAHEFFFLLYVYRGEFEELLKYCTGAKDISNIEMVSRMIDGVDTLVPKKARLSTENIKRLVAKDYIVYTGHSEELNMPDLTIKEEFLAILEAEFGDAKAENTDAQVFFDAYPGIHTPERGTPITIKSIGFDEFVKVYNSEVAVEDREVLLKFVQHHQDKINIKIDNFLRNGLYKDYLKRFVTPKSQKRNARARLG